MIYPDYYSAFADWYWSIWECDQTFKSICAYGLVGAAVIGVVVTSIAASSEENCNFGMYIVLFPAYFIGSAIFMVFFFVIALPILAYTWLPLLLGFGILGIFRLAYIFQRNRLSTLRQNVEREKRLLGEDYIDPESV